MDQVWKTNPYICPAADDDFDTSFAGDTLTSKQEAFAQAWARTGNKAAAYREAYNVHPSTLPQSVWKNAQRMAALAKIQRRYDEIQRAAAMESIISIREMLQHQLDIATADPNELAYLAKRPCRYCFGINHRYQWVDEQEHFEATVKALDEGRKGPSDEGGFGFLRARDPSTDCPHCLGNGVEEIVINDTRNLEGKARKLYAGLDFKQGQWVIRMHDQLKAWETIGRMIGAFKESIDARPPGERAQASKIISNNERDVVRDYIGLMR